MFARLVFLMLLCSVPNVENSKILGVFHMPSHSHFIIGKTLFKALAEKGHQVTMISSFPLKSPTKNYEDIYLDGMIKFKEEGSVKMLMEAENQTVFSKISLALNVLMEVNEVCLKHHAVKKLLASDKTFDLVLIDWALTDAMLGFAHHYKAPVIAVSASGSSFISNKITANPAPYAYVPNHLFTVSDEMTFLERVVNTLSTASFELLDHFYYEPAQDQMLHQYFPEAPPLKQLIRNISMVFLNSHFSTESPKPYVPNMIQIAGIHLDEVKELEGELKKFMDSASEGVLLFSLGGNAKSSELSEDKLKAIIGTFRKLPVKVLWKFESDQVPELPANVKIGKWLPQTDILAHPNLKVFVTHGGLLSTTESLYRGVPMVGLPCFGDQMANVKMSVDQGYSTMVILDDLTEEALFEAIMEVLKNPRYHEKAKERSRWLKDQPLKPLDSAIFWVEYVLRHRGAPHLQTSALKLTWYQYLLLDVIAFLLALVAVTILVLIKTVTFLKRLVCNKRSSKGAKKTAKKIN